MKQSRIRNILTHMTYPGMFVFAISSAFLLHRNHVSFGVSVAICAVLISLLAAVLEKIHPASTDWGATQKDALADIQHALISNSMPSFVLEVFLKSFLVGIATSMVASGIDFWPDRWPLIAQVFLALFAAEIGFYVVHRFFHECNIPAIWKWHAAHHTIERMYFIAGSRTHPVQVLISFGVTVAILWFLGAPDEVIYYKTVFHTTNGILQHCNIEIKGGIWNWIFAGPELHRWHHSREIKESDANYGNNLILLDVLLGTRFFPKDRSSIRDLGLPFGTRYTNTFWGHLKIPFEWKKNQPIKKDLGAQEKKDLERQEEVAT